MSASFEAILGVVTVSAVIISYFSGVWGIYGHFLTVGKIEPGMKLVSLLSIFGMIWFLATRWTAGTLSQSADPGRDLVALALLAIFTILFWWGDPNYPPETAEPGFQQGRTRIHPHHRALCLDPAPLLHRLHHLLDRHGGRRRDTVVLGDAHHHDGALFTGH